MNLRTEMLSSHADVRSSITRTKILWTETRSISTAVLNLLRRVEHMSFVIRVRTSSENWVTGALCDVYLSITITTSFSNLMIAFNQAILTNVYSQGGCCNPWIFDSPSELFCEIVHGYVVGVKESNGDS